MACPFFMPSERFEDGVWLHPLRLPLGCGWNGLCTAPEHNGESPSPDELQQFCNLGYAANCPRLPRERAWDSVRFGARAIAGKANAETPHIRLRYICERSHRPVEHGFLEFNPTQNIWLVRHPDPRIQRMAECFATSFLERRRVEGRTPAAADRNPQLSQPL